jgi:hypothetical protein
VAGGEAVTLEEMTGRLSQRLNEGATGPVFYPLAELVAALNEAHRFFVLLTLGLETTATWNVPAYNPAAPFHRMLQYFPDWIVPLRIATAAGAKVRPARLDELTSLDPRWWNSPGTPSRYAALGVDFLGLYKQAAGGTTLHVTYARGPVALANLTDVPETPAEYHPRYVSYGLYRLRQVEGGQEFEKVLPELDAFLEGAIRYGKYVRSRNLGSRYDKVPFELEKFDRSQLLKMRKDLVPTRRAA